MQSLKDLWEKVNFSRKPAPQELDVVEIEPENGMLKLGTHVFQIANISTIELSHSKKGDLIDVSVESNIPEAANVFSKSSIKIQAVGVVQDGPMAENIRQLALRLKVPLSEPKWYWA